MLFQQITGLWSATSRRIMIPRFHRAAHAGLLVCLLLWCFNPALAQSDSCQIDAVPVGMQGLMCATGVFTITLAGTAASGQGFQCDGLHDWTPKVWPKLIPNKTYTVTAGVGICITSINFDVPQGYTLYIDGYASNTIDKTNGGMENTGDGSWSVVLRKDCDCGSNKPAETVQSLGSVTWETGLGNLVDGRSAETISIREKVLSLAIYTPSVLVYSPPPHTTEVDVVRNPDGSLRQVKAPQSFVDVVVINSSEYDIRYYNPSSVGAKDAAGVYALSGQPYVTWKMKNPDPATVSKLQILKVESGVTTNKSEYSWDSAVDSWTLSTGWSPATGTYSRIETKTVSYPTATARTETFVVKESNGQVVAKRTKTYLNYPWGEALVQEVVDPDADALTTTYTYYEDANEDRRYRKIKSITFPDGSWEKYDYDNYWNISSVLRPWKDQSLVTATEANSYATLYGYSNSDNGVVGISNYRRIPYDVEERIGGITVRKLRYNRSVASFDTPQQISTAESFYQSSDGEGAPANLVTQTITTRFHTSAPPFLKNRISAVEYRDHRKDTYSYERGNYVPNADPSLSQFTPDENGLAERDTIVHGTATSLDGIAFKTTKDVTVRDQYGNQVLQETYVFNGSSYERINWAVSDFDNRGHVTMSRNEKGEITTAVWNGQLKTSEIDTTGIETVYTYDALNRIKTRTKKGVAPGGAFPPQADVVTTLEYDAQGNQTSETVAGGILSLTSSRSYDRAGRLTRVTDQAGLSTTYSYANGGRTQTVTHPGGTTQVSDKYLDGQQKSVIGTAVVASYFDYGANADGTRYRQEFAGPSGLSSPRWLKTTSDWVNRTVAVEKPGFTGANVVEASVYNSLGQLQKQTTTANSIKLIADVLFEYDQLGQQIRSGSDIDASDTLTTLSTDRLTEIDTYYEKTGNDWFLVTSTRTYLADNNDTPITRTERKRLNNFALNGTDQIVSEVTTTDIVGNNTKNTTTTDRIAKKQTTTTNTPDSNINAVAIRVNGLLQSSTPTTPQTATTYAYDSLGRNVGVTDPRAGTASRIYNSNGQLQSVSEGEGVNSYIYYDKTNLNAGRLKSQTNAAGKGTYFNYNSRGELIQTWGDATYPLEYVYDTYGQRTESHTFRAGQNWGASLWPIPTIGVADVTKWIYQESTGLLTQKLDATQKGTSYTYDALGRMKTRVWARGTTCTYGYDANTGELRTITYSDSTPAVSFSYDRGGRQAYVTDAAGVHARTFNVGGELQTEQITGGILDGITVTVGYDGFLRRTSLQSSQPAQTLSSQTYAYDANSRLETITSGGLTATYSYYPNTGLLNTTYFTGGTNIVRSYDSFGRLQSISTTPTADTGQSYTYTYNNLNQRTRITREDGSYWSYLYNDRGELKSGKKYWSDNSVVWGEQREYNFDNIGNRNYAKQGGNQLGTLRHSTYTINSLNEYTQRSVPGGIDIMGTANTNATVSVNSQSTMRRGEYFYRELVVDNTIGSAYPVINVVGARNNFGAGGEDAITEKGGHALLAPASEVITYDDDGNLMLDGKWTYSWDAQNRLIEMESRPGVAAEARLRLNFAYDYIGRRVQKKLYKWNIATSSFQLQTTDTCIYDGWNLIADIVNNGPPSRSYVWGQDISGTLRGAGGIGGLLSINDGGSSYISGFDGSGSLVSLINSNTGRNSASFEYDPFGVTIMAVGEYVSQTPFGFATKYTDRETNLIYYGLRYYDPENGRFVSRDPIGQLGGVNLFGYASNDPQNRADLSGLYEIDVHYYLTYYLAMKTGCFNDAQAREIANGDQGTDEDEKTKPGLGSNQAQKEANAFYHALHPGSHQPYLDTHWARATLGNNGSLSQLGTYLHYLQDTYSHKGVTDPVCGHGCFDWHWNDKTDSNPDRAIEMAQQTWYALKKFASEKRNCKCKEWQDASWNEVRRFAKASGGPDNREINADELEHKRQILGVPRR